MALSGMEELDIAVAAALAAGAILTARDAAPELLAAEGRNVKLGEDLRAEGAVLEVLRDRCPYPVLSEEAGADGRVAGADRFWVVDPLDGSANYLRGIPFSCVSVALVAERRPVLGVTYDLHRNELFTGGPGLGCWVGTGEEPRLRESRVSEVRAIGEAYLATGLPVERDFSSAALQRFVTDLSAFRKVRMMGSAGLSLAYVACGRVDAYAEDDIMLWDVSAGIALVLGAGGSVSWHETGRAAWTVRVRAASDRAIWSSEGDGNGRDRT